MQINLIYVWKMEIGAESDTVGLSVDWRKSKRDVDFGIDFMGMGPMFSGDYVLFSCMRCFDRVMGRKWQKPVWI